VTVPKNAPDATRGTSHAARDRSVLVDAEIDDVPAAPPTRVGSRRGLVYLGLCLVLIGLNLRTVFSSFSAVLPEVTADAGLPGWAVVVLTTAPVTLLGVFVIFPDGYNLARATMWPGAFVEVAALIVAVGYSQSALSYSYFSVRLCSALSVLVTDVTTPNWPYPVVVVSFTAGLFGSTTIVVKFPWSS